MSQVGPHFGTKVPLNPNEFVGPHFSSIFDWCWDHLELSYNITWRGTYKVALIFAFLRHPTMHMSYNLSFFSIDVLRTCCLVWWGRFKQWMYWQRSVNYKTPVLFSDILLSICEKVRQSKLRYGFALAVFTFYWVDAPLTVQTCLDCYELFEDLPEEEVKGGCFV